MRFTILLVAGCSFMGPSSRRPGACLEPAAPIADGVGTVGLGGLAGYAMYRSAHPNDEDLGSVALFAGTMLIGLAVVESVATAYGIHEVRTCNQAR
jgi:hypothetical protein